VPILPRLVPACSVIVCTRYRSQSLERCLASLEGMDGLDPEVIVVDNTPGDPETERVTTGAGARYVVETKSGLSRARNAGIDAATGELIAFLDDDAVADRAWLSRHLEVLADESLMASTGRILPVAKARGPDLGEEPFVVDHNDPWWFERANFGGLGGGANMAFKYEAFGRGMRFRETLGLGADIGGFEENYFWFKMIESGARIAYVPGAVIWHGPELSVEPAGRRTARDHSAVAAYLTMLLSEEPGFRARTVRYIVRLLRRQRLPWRPGPAPSRLKVLVNGSSGPLLYLRSRLASK
jgi:glycosyltransferase involved in cell wall biosynthesis